MVAARIFGAALLVLVISCESQPDRRVDVAWLRIRTVEPQFPDRVGLADLEKIVIARDAACLAARKNVEAAIYQARETGIDFGPMFSANYHFFPSGGEVVGNDLPTRQSLTLKVGQDLIALWKRKPVKEDVALLELEQSVHELSAVEQKALLEIRKDYLDVLEERVRISRYTELKYYLESALEKQKAALEQKRILPIDYKRIENDLADARGNLAQAQAREKSKVEALAVRYGKNIVYEKPSQQPEFPREEELTLRALDVNPALNILKLNQKIAETNRRYVDDRYNITPFAGYQIRQDRDGDYSSGPVLGVELDVPILTMGANKYREQKYGALSSRWLHERDKAASDLTSAIASAFSSMRSEFEKMSKLERDENLAKEEIQVEKMRGGGDVKGIYSKETVTFSLESSLILMDMQKEISSLEVAKYNSELAYLSGGELAMFKVDEPIELWCWRAARIAADKDSFLDFCKARNVKKVHLSFNKEFMEALDGKGCELLKSIEDAGISCTALLADNEWANPEKRKHLIERIKQIVALGVTTIHLDIEPHTLPEWKSEKESLKKQFVDTLRESAAVCPALEVDVPAFYIKEDIARELFAIVSSLTIMEYENPSADKVADNVKKWLEVSTKKVVVGLRAKDFASIAQVNEFMRTIKQKIPDCTFAIHDYDTLKDLK